MAPGSVSALTDYTQTVSAANTTPAGSVPPTGNLPITFTPALGDNVTYTVLNVAEEAFTKTVDKAFADIGDILTYTISVENPNNFAVNNVLVTDAIPVGTTFVPGSVTGATGVPPTLALTSPIAVGGSAVVTFQVQVGEILPQPNPIPNTATISFTYTVNPDNPAGATGDGTSNTVTTLVSHAEAEPVKSVDKAYAKPGDILTYTLTVTNTGNVTANNGVLVDPVPAGTTLVPGSVTGATGVPPTMKLINPIPAGGSAVVTFKVRVNGIPAVNPIPNTAVFSYNYTVDPTDPKGKTETKHSNTVTTQISVAVLTTTKSVDKHTAYVGDYITYQLGIKNTGNVPANNVVLTDLLPNGVSFVPGTLMVSLPYSGTLSSGIQFTDPIAPGQIVTLSFQVKVTDMPNPNPVINYATVHYTYTVDPRNPNGEPGNGTSNKVCTLVFRYRLAQQINDIIESVALEEAALAAIANGEGAKIQKLAAMGGVSPQELLCLNESVNDMMDSIAMLEFILKQKLAILGCQIEGCSK